MRLRCSMPGIQDRTRSMYSSAAVGGIRQASQGYFEILPRDEIGDESQSPDKKVRVVTTISYRLK